MDLSSVSDGELTLLSDYLSSVREEFNDLNKRYFEFIERCPHNYPQKNELFKQYDKSIKETETKKSEYESNVIKEMQNWELTRNKIQDIKNEIKLPKFLGYHSELDSIHLNLDS